jgi:hypothetical protein
MDRVKATVGAVMMIDAFAELRAIRKALSRAE